MQEGTSPIGNLENSEKDVEIMLATLIRVFARKKTAWHQRISRRSPSFFPIETGFPSDAFTAPRSSLPSAPQASIEILDAETSRR
jgi:hypothetical protein